MMRRCCAGLAATVGAGEARILSLRLGEVGEAETADGVGAASTGVGSEACVGRRKHTAARAPPIACASFNTSTALSPTDYRM